MNWLPFIVAGLSWAVAARAEPPPVPHARASLRADMAAIEPGLPFRLAVVWTMDSGPHLAWRNPGETGLPPTVRWTLPPGFVAGPLEWPAPERLISDTSTAYGYTREAALWTVVTPPAVLPVGEDLVLGAQAEWVLCGAEGCVPEEADLVLRLPVAAGAASLSADHPLLERLAARTPVAASDWSFSFRETEDALDLAVRVPEGVDVSALRRARFFPLAADVGDPGQTPWKASGPGRATLRLPRATSAAAPPRLEGVLVFDVPPGQGQPLALRVSAAKTMQPNERKEQEP